MASESDVPHKKPSEEAHSSSELLSSAKLVAEAAQSAYRRESDKVDKAKAADAAGDLLDAAAQYGKLDDTKGVGQYVNKAADYLHNYQSSQSQPHHPAPTTTSESESDSSKPADEPSAAGGGLGDFAKFAGGFLKKP